MDKFNIDIPSLILINGMQGCGKSHLIRFIMQKYRKKFNYGIVMSNTSFDTQDSGFNYIPQEFIYPEFSEEAITNLMNIQGKIVEKKGLDKTPHSFIILDDCLYDANQFNSPVLKKLCTQLRHFNITCIFSSQYCNAISSVIRANAMSVFIFKSFTKRNTDSLFESYGQAHDNSQDFKAYLNENTGDYKFIFYNKMEITKDNPLSAYHVLKCPSKIPKFKINYNRINK